MEKVIKDGKVAVLFSPGFGPSWTNSFERDSEERKKALFDPQIVTAILANKPEIIPEIIRAQYPDFYNPRVNLQITWVPTGSLFVVREYDGNEYVEIFDEKHWDVA